MKLNQFKAMFDQTPELIVATLGLACCLAPFESKILTTLTGIYPVELSLVVRHFIAFCAALTVFLLLSKKPGFQIGGKKRAFVSIAVFFSLCLLAKYEVHFFGVTLPIIEMAGKLLEEAAGVLLILVWAECLIPYGMKRCLVVLGTSFIAAATIQILISIFQQIPAMLILSLLPLASGGLYGFFKTSLALRLLRYPQTHQDEDHMIDVSKKDDTAFALENSPTVYYIIIFCILFNTGHIIFGSLETQQSMASSPIAQNGIASGTLFAGVLILVLLDYLDNRLFIAVCSLILFALLAIAFYLTTLTQGPWISSFLSVNAMVIKFAVMLIWIAPFLLHRNISAMAQMAFGYVIYFAAHVCTAVFMEIDSTFMLQVFDFIAIGVLIVLLICSLDFLFSYNNFSRNDPDKQLGAVSDNNTASKPFQNILIEMGLEFNLTPTEQKILLLLAKGRNVKYISESLVVTSNTVKSHMRKIYIKLDVHTQQELISLIDSLVRRQKMK
jgi:DNA-binding CsgD family transcriptional regulator